MFRLGSPLLDGLQHDVQWPFDDQLDQQPFYCSTDGQVEVSGTYANIYPNDYARTGTGGSKDKVKGEP